MSVDRSRLPVVCDGMSRGRLLGFLDIDPVPERVDWWPAERLAAAMDGLAAAVAAGRDEREDEAA